MYWNDNVVNLRPDEEKWFVTEFASFVNQSICLNLPSKTILEPGYCAVCVRRTCSAEDGGDPIVSTIDSGHYGRLYVGESKDWLQLQLPVISGKYQGWRRYSTPYVEAR